MWLRVVSVVLVLLLAGCDPFPRVVFYGVESHTILPGPVDVQCVNAALTSVPEAGPVTYQRNEIPTFHRLLVRLFPTLWKDNGEYIINVWAYGERGRDLLQIFETPDHWSYYNTRSRARVAVPHEELARFVPLMQKVNRVIGARCGLPVADLRAEPKPGKV